MRILYVSPSGALGGAERVLLTLLDGLRRSRPDWPLRLVALEPGPLVDFACAVGCDARTLPAPARLLSLGERGRTAAATLTQAARAVVPVRRYVREVAASVDEWRPDVVHANGLKAHVLSAMISSGGRPLVWHMHDYVGQRRISSALLRWYAPRASCAVAVSNSVAADVETSLGPAIAVQTIYNGIDTARFGACSHALDLDALAGLTPAPADTVRIGLAATYARWKGQQTFVQALAALPSALPVRGYVIGGPLYATRQSQYAREELLEYISAAGLGGRVGLVPFQADMARAYHALDVLVHASTEPEPFGLVVIEGMASGRAVIASAGGGTRELVDEGRTGLLHRSGDARDLATQIERLVRDPGLRARLATAGQAHAISCFSSDAMTAGFAQLYEHLAAQGALMPGAGAEPACTT